MPGLSAVTAALDARDRDAFAAAVAELPGLPDDHFLYDHPLIGWVARQGWGDGVEVLLEAGSNPKKLPGVLHMGIFPTFLYDPDVRPLELLIEAGADIEAYQPDRMGTPLQAASVVIEERGAAITALLLAHGADPNRAPNGSWSPLFNACVRPCVETVRLLLEAGADPNGGDGDDVPPLHAAISELVNAVRRSADNPDDNSAEIAAHFAPRAVALLAEHGADVTATHNGRDVMWRLLAMAECPPGLFEAVLDAGAPTDGHIEFKGESVDYLAFAVYRGAPVSVLRRLVAAGCPLDKPYACLSDQTVARVLAGWLPDAALTLWDAFDAVGEALLAARTPKGASALDLAAVNGSEALVRRLHAAGLALTVANADGKSTLDLVREHRPEMAPLIEELQAAEAS